MGKATHSVQVELLSTHMIATNTCFLMKAYNNQQLTTNNQYLFPDDPEFYNMFHSQWKCTFHLTKQSWEQYKAELLATVN